MISDIVLLRELPNFIKESVEAYIGCVSGAIIKDEYLQKITVAGFHDVRVVDETLLPVELMANDPTVKGIIDNLGVALDEVKGLASSVASIKVSGMKAIDKG
jgi:hypothetical protein